jgi:hypothetical protein
MIIPKDALSDRHCAAMFFEPVQRLQKPMAVLLRTGNGYWNYNLQNPSPDWADSFPPPLHGLWTATGH